MQKTKSITRLEDRMGGLEPSSFRYRTLEAAKNFKSSWIELGQHLYTVYSDKLYRDWGYSVFETYCAKELGIRQMTAVKLLKSYSFLEKEEPEFLKQSVKEDRGPSRIPGYEAVNALRLAKVSGRLPEDDYEDLREEVLDGGSQDAEVKKKIRYVLKAHARAQPPKNPETARAVLLKRLLQSLESAKEGLSALDGPAKILKQINVLIETLEDL